MRVRKKEDGQCESGGLDEVAVVMEPHMYLPQLTIRSSEAVFHESLVTFPCSSHYCFPASEFFRKWMQRWLRKSRWKNLPRG